MVEGLRSDPHRPHAGLGRARIEVELRADHRRAHDRLLRILRSRRHERLLDRLDRFLSAQPLTTAAGHGASNVPAKPIRRTYRRLSSLVTTAPSADPRDLDPWPHEIRKAAKQLRYTGSSRRPAITSVPSQNRVRVPEPCSAPSSANGGVSLRTFAEARPAQQPRLGHPATPPGHLKQPVRCDAEQSQCRAMARRIVPVVSGFRTANDDDRALRVGGQGVAGGAEQHPGEAAAAVATDDNHLGMATLLE